LLIEVLLAAPEIYGGDLIFMQVVGESPWTIASKVSKEFAISQDDYI
jgi:hypothetical protein